MAAGFTPRLQQRCGFWSVKQIEISTAGPAERKFSSSCPCGVCKMHPLRSFQKWENFIGSLSQPNLHVFENLQNVHHKGGLENSKGC